jgi:hypothetical protein
LSRIACWTRNDEFGPARLFVTLMPLHDFVNANRFVGKQRRLVTLLWGKSSNPFIDAFATLSTPDGNRRQIDLLVALRQQTTSP